MRQGSKTTPLTRAPRGLSPEGRGLSGRGQALVELALVMPMLAGIIAVLFQLGILFVVYLSVVHATRDVGRWISVHPDTTDSMFLAHVAADMPSTIDAANLTAQVVPACPSLTNGRCASRPAGTTLQIHMSYDAQSSVFLPARISWGFFTFAVPLALPPYDYYVMVEQH